MLPNPIIQTSMKVIDKSKEREFTDKSTADDIMRSIKGLGDVCFLLFSLHRWIDLAPVKSGAGKEKRLGEYDRKIDRSSGCTLAVMGKLREGGQALPNRWCHSITRAAAVL